MIYSSCNDGIQGRVRLSCFMYAAFTLHLLEEEF